MKSIYLYVWYVCLVSVYCIGSGMDDTSMIKEGIRDAVGYQISDHSYITITAPHILINPAEAIKNSEDFQTCRIQLHSGSDELDIAPILAYMPSLTALYISNMPVTKILLPQKKSYVSMNHFEVSDTHITKLELEEIFTAFPRVKSLIVKNNKILDTIIYPINYRQSLQEIDLRNNALQSIDLNTLLIISAKLAYINVSNNPLQSIQWIPDDFVAHHKFPEVIVKNVRLPERDKNLFLKQAADDNKIYLWMKKFVPALFALSFSGGFYHGSDSDFKMTVIMSGVGIPIGYLLGRLLVDKVLFPKPEDKRLPYFKPVFE